MKKMQIVQILAQIVLVLVLVFALGAGGKWLNENGKDAVSINSQKKDSLLAVEQTNVSFQQVSGRVTNIPITESQFVSQDTVLMELDMTDIDLQLEQTTIQLSVMDEQIALARASINDYDINIQQNTIQIAQDNLDNLQKNLERLEALFDVGAVPETSIEDAQLKLSSAEKTISQNQEVLLKYQTSIEIAEMNVKLLEEQKKSLQVQLETLQEQKSRRILKAPSDGTILRIVPKVGENVAAGSPVVILQSNRLYFDLYVTETQVNRFTVGETVPVYVVAMDKTIPGFIQYVINAPQYTSMRMSRDSSQGDLSSFQVRIYLKEDTEGLLSGMTVEVKTDDSN